MFTPRSLPLTPSHSLLCAPSLTPSQGDLFDEMKRSLGRMPESQLVTSVLLPMMSALLALHAAGFIHRDIKPENTLFAANRVLKLAGGPTCVLVHYAESGSLFMLQAKHTGMYARGRIQAGMQAGWSRCHVLFMGVGLSLPPVPAVTRGPTLFTPWCFQAYRQRPVLCCVLEA